MPLKSENEPLDAAIRAGRYRRKLEDLLNVSSELLTNLPLAQLEAKQKPLAMALANEVYVVRSQLENEDRFYKSRSKL